MLSETKISACGELRNGLNYCQQDEGFGLPILKVKDFKEHTLVPVSGLDELDPSRIQMPKDLQLREGDTVIIRSNGNGNLVGRCLFVRELQRPTAFSGFCIRFRPNCNTIEPRFAFYVLKSPETRERLVAHGSGTGIQSLNQETIGGATFLLPSRAEQSAIAGLLGSLDDKIELNRRMNRTLEELAAALFRSWFVDFDPVVAKAAGRSPAHLRPELAALFSATFQDSPLGPIPHGWEVKTIEDIARYVNGRAFTKGATGTGRMVIRIAELNSGPGGSTVYNDVAAAPENVAHLGDLLFAWSGSLDVYRWYRDEAIINQHIFKVICEKYLQWFVHQQLREAMPFFQDIAADKATTMGHIKREHLSQAFLALPPKDLLDAADKIFQPLYAKQLANERESLTLAALRDTLLPKLLSGELRVPAATKLVEANV